MNFAPRQLVHAKTNCDGYKEQGITFPSGPMQKQLLDEVYEECNVDPATIDFLEAHATGMLNYLLDLHNVHYCVLIEKAIAFKFNVKNLVFLF